MRFCSLFLARFCVAAWVGAAVLFVVVGITEVVHPGFDSEIRDQLVVLRFPWFYRFGMTLVGLGLAGAAFTKSGHDFSAHRKTAVIILLAMALVIMAVEYGLVYLPLVEAVIPPGKPRTPEFAWLHRASMWANLADLLLCLAAATLLNWPARSNP